MSKEHALPPTPANAVPAPGRSVELLQGVVDASPLAIIVTDAEGTVEIWNPAAERTLGWCTEEIVGAMPNLDIDAESILYEWLPRCLSGESVADISTKLRCKDGSIIDINLWLAPLRDSDDEIHFRIELLDGLVLPAPAASQQRAAVQDLGLDQGFGEAQAGFLVEAPSVLDCT